MNKLNPINASHWTWFRTNETEISRPPRAAQEPCKNYPQQQQQ